MNLELRRGSRGRVFRPCSLLLVVLFFCVCLQPVVRAQETNTDASATPDTNAIAGTPDEQRAALQAEITNAWQGVIKIVNQPARAYARTAGLSVSVYPYWFHPGASIPDFDTVDVRKTQDLHYANQPYVTSDLNPNVVFMGRDLEFNSMTKLFYVDRSLPKHRLSEAEMLEVNRLYRIIGRCQRDIRRLQTQLDAQAAQSNNVEAAADTEPATPAQSQPLDAIRRIPRQTRLLYGGIAIGALVLIAVLLRIVRKKSD